MMCKLKCGFIGLLILALIQSVGCKAYDCKGDGYFDEDNVVHANYIKNDPEVVALVRVLKNISPVLLLRRIRSEVSVPGDGDVISAMVLSIPSYLGVSISYYGDKLSWSYRQAMPNTTFSSSLTNQNLYTCLEYVRQDLRIDVYYLKNGDEWRIFLLDKMSGELPEDFLPKGVKCYQPNSRHTPRRIGGGP